jgi:hypothetical protein
MRTRITVSVGLAGALFAVAAMQFPDAALALNPQPEVPSKPNPNPYKKSKKHKSKSQKHLPPNPIKR